MIRLEFDRVALTLVADMRFVSLVEGIIRRDSENKHSPLLLTRMANCSQNNLNGLDIDRLPLFKAEIENPAMQSL